MIRCPRRPGCQSAAGVDRLQAGRRAALPRPRVPARGWPPRSRRSRRARQRVGVLVGATPSIHWPPMRLCFHAVMSGLQREPRRCSGGWRSAAPCARTRPGCPSTRWPMARSGVVALARAAAHHVVHARQGVWAPGARSNTSSPAPAMRPFWQARISAASSTTVPRATIDEEAPDPSALEHSR